MSSAHTFLIVCVSKSLTMESLLHLNNTSLTVGLLQLNAGISYRPARKENFFFKKRVSIQGLSPMMDLADLAKRRTALWSFFLIGYS